MLASVFPKNGAPRVMLRGLHCKGDVPDDVKAVLAKPGGRLDLEIPAAGYRSGKLASIAS